MIYPYFHTSSRGSSTARASNVCGIHLELFTSCISQMCVEYIWNFHILYLSVHSQPDRQNTEHGKNLNKLGKYKFRNEQRCFEVLFQVAQKVKEREQYKPLGRFSLQVAMSVTCLSVCLSVHVWKPRFPVGWRLLVEERIANIGIPLDVVGLLQLP